MAIFTFIGAAIFGAGTFLAGLTAAGLEIAAGIAVNLLAKAISGSSSQASSFGVQGTLQSGGDLSRSIMFGYSATSGSLVYANEWGEANKTPNAYFTQVICIGDMPITSLAEVWVNGELCTLDATPHASYGYPVLEYRKDSVDYLWVKFYDGTQTTADSFLTGTVASAARPYASTRVGVGCPYVIATSLVNETLFTGFPTFKFAVHGVKLYDPSQDTSVGGSGTQRWATPSTWGGDGDDFPAVQIYNLLRGMSYNSQWLYGLQNLPAARLPDADWIAAIGKCRTTITGPSGAEATYRSGGEVAVSAPIANAIEALLTSCQGRLAETGGTYKLHLGAPDSSVYSFTDADIISTEDQTFTPFFGLSNTINGISASYPNPAEGWNKKVAPPLYNATYEVEDGNRRLMADVSLDMVPYGGQVQRLMKSALAEGRRARRHTHVLPPDAFLLEPGDTVTWTSARNGYASKQFRIDGIVDKANLDLMVDFTEVDPADYSWDQAVDFTTVVDGPVTIVRPSSQPIISWSVVAESVLDDTSAARKPSMRISWDGAQPDVRAVAFEVRLTSSAAVIYSAQIDDVATGSALLPPVFLANTSYDARGKYVPVSNRDTSWSSWLTVTTPDDRISSADISDALQAAADALLTTGSGSLVAQLDAMRAQIEQAGQGTANSQYGTKIQRDLLSTSLGNIAAAVLTTSEVQALSNSALASTMTQVATQIQNGTASGLFKIEAASKQAGESVRLSLYVRTTTGSTFKEAGIFLVITTGGVAKIYFDADIFEFFSGTSSSSLTYTPGVSFVVGG